MKTLDETNKERLAALNLNKEEMKKLMGYLPGIPHGKGTDVERGIFIKPTREDLEEYFSMAIDMYIENKGK